MSNHTSLHRLQVSQIEFSKAIREWIKDVHDIEIPEDTVVTVYYNNLAMVADAAELTPEVTWEENHSG